MVFSSFSFLLLLPYFHRSHAKVSAQRCQDTRRHLNRLRTRNAILIGLKGLVEVDMDEGEGGVAAVEAQMTVEETTRSFSETEIEVTVLRDRIQEVGHLLQYQAADPGEGEAEGV